MKNQEYLALLRGINVGGNNIIKMAALKTCFEDMGLKDVMTYIQSGNVLFRPSYKASARHAGNLLASLEKKIEGALSKKFNYQSRVVVISHDQLKETVKRAPKGFGSDLARHRYDVIFLKPPLIASEAMKSTSMKPGVDQAFAGKYVLYFSRLIAKAVQSHLTHIIKQPVYKSMTIRNWNTTTKLLAMMEAREK